MIKANELLDEITQLGDRKQLSMMKEKLKEFEAFYLENKTQEIADLYSTALYNSHIDYVNSDQIDDLKATAEELEVLYLTHGSIKILHNLAKTQQGLLRWYSKKLLIEEFEKILEKIRKLYRETSDEITKEKYIDSVYYALNACSESQDLDKILQYRGELFSQRSKDLKSINKIQVVEGLSNTIAYLGRMREFKIIEDFLEDLRTVCKELLNEGLEKYLILGLYNASKYYGMNRKIAEMEKTLDEFEKTVFENQTDFAITQLLIGYRNAILSYELVKNYDSIKDVLNKVPQSLSKYNIYHKIEYSNILAVAIEIYAVENKTTEMDESLKKLAELCETNPHTSIREKLLRLTDSSIELFDKLDQKNLSEKWKRIRTKQ